MQITFDVAISTSEAMRFQAESLVIVKNRIWCFDFKLKQFLFKDFPAAKIYLTVCFDFLSVCSLHREHRLHGVSWYDNLRFFPPASVAQLRRQLRTSTRLFSFRCKNKVLNWESTPQFLSSANQIRQRSQQSNLIGRFYKRNELETLSRRVFHVKDSIF